ncbi:MAG: preprotein translocase subunit SecG [Leadbetterella sp.]
MVSSIIILMLVVAVLLTLVVLIQNPKGGGLSSEFGGNSTQMFGVQRTGDILEKLTWGFFAFLIVAALGVNFLAGSGQPGENNSELNVESNVALPRSATPSPAPTTGNAQPAPANSGAKPAAPQPAK